jgi:hypothetical protein
MLPHQVHRCLILLASVNNRITVFIFRPKFVFFAGFRSPELRSLAFGRNLQRWTSFIEFVQSTTLRNGPSAFYYLFHKITLLIAWKNIEIFIRFLSCLRIEPRIFGFKVNTRGQATKQPTNFRRKIFNLCISNFFAENLFQGTKFGRINIKPVKPWIFPVSTEFPLFNWNSFWTNEIHKYFAEARKKCRLFGENSKNGFIPYWMPDCDDCDGSFGILSNSFNPGCG